MAINVSFLCLNNVMRSITVSQYDSIFSIYREDRVPLVDTFRNSVSCKNDFLHLLLIKEMI